MKASFISWMVAAPDNNPLKNESKRYRGVGGHLFSIAVQRSEESGYGGAVCGFAASEKLMKHYCVNYGAEPLCILHPYQIFISEDAARDIKEVYDYEWTDDII
ncbi:MAG: hypothetical protein ACI4EN_06225 [Butyrivibrio sp.]